MHYNPYQFRYKLIVGDNQGGFYLFETSKLLNKQLAYFDFETKQSSTYKVENYKYYYYQNNGYFYNSDILFFPFDNIIDLKTKTFLDFDFNYQLIGDTINYYNIDDRKEVLRDSTLYILEFINKNIVSILKYSLSKNTSELIFYNSNKSFGKINEYGFYNDMIEFFFIKNQKIFFKIFGNSSYFLIENGTLQRKELPSEYPTLNLNYKITTTENFNYFCISNNSITRLIRLDDNFKCDTIVELEHLNFYYPYWETTDNQLIYYKNTNSLFTLIENRVHEFNIDENKWHTYPDVFLKQ